MPCWASAACCSATRPRTPTTRSWRGPEDVKDDSYYRARKALLMEEIADRFGSLLTVVRQQRGEERFLPRGDCPPGTRRAGATAGPPPLATAPTHREQMGPATRMVGSGRGPPCRSYAGSEFQKGSRRAGPPDRREPGGAGPDGGQRHSWARRSWGGSGLGAPRRGEGLHRSEGGRGAGQSRRGSSRERAAIEPVHSGRKRGRCRCRAQGPGYGRATRPEAATPPNPPEGAAARLLLRLVNADGKILGPPGLERGGHEEQGPLKACAERALRKLLADSDGSR
jgi:hypothetical protein